MTTCFRRVPGLLALLAAAVLVAPIASADEFFPDGLEARDQERLEAFEEIRAHAIERMRVSGTREEIAALEAVLEGYPVELSLAQMTGEWRCRLLHVAWPIIYPDFRCRIFEDGMGLRLEKMTGSQRTSGYFYDVPGYRLGYAGAVFYPEVSWIAPQESWVAYGDDPDRSQVGYLIALSPDRMRLELVGYSLSVLELRR